MPFAQPTDPVKENSPESDQTQDSFSLTSLVCILFAGTVRQSTEQTRRQAPLVCILSAGTVGQSTEQTHRQARTRAEKLTGTQADKQTSRQAYQTDRQRFVA